MVRKRHVSFNLLWQTNYVAYPYEQLSYAQYTVLFAMLNRLGTELNNTVLIMIIGLFNEQTDNSLGNSPKIARGFSTDLD